MDDILPTSKAFEIYQNLLKENQVTLHDGSVLLVSITPYYLSKKQYQEVSMKSELVMEAVEIILGQYLVNPDIQAYFPEVDHLKKFISMDAKHNFKRWSQLSRFDFILNEEGKFGLLELNTSTPGSLLLAPSCKSLLERVPPYHGNHSKNLEIYKQPIDSLDFFFNHLTKYYQETRNTNQHPCIAFVYNGVFRPVTTDKTQFLELGKKYGFDVIEGTYDQLKYNGEYLSIQGKKIDIVWNKSDLFINEKDGKFQSGMYQHSIDEIKPLIDAYNDTNVLFVNGWLSLFVSESKKTLAIMKDPKFSHLFTKDQLQAIEDLIPPTFVLNSKDDGYQQLLQSVLKNKDLYVIKSALDSRGRMIFIGKEIGQDEWERIVTQAIDGPFAIQEFMKSKQIEAHSPKLEKIVEMTSTLAFFIVGGKSVGLVVRSSPSLVHNVNHAGGVLQISYIID